MDYISKATGQYPALARHYAELGESWGLKLWHQMALKLLSLSSDDEFRAENRILQLYNGFVKRFAADLNPLVYTQFAISACEQMQASEEAVAFLQELGESKEVSGHAASGLLVTLAKGRLDVARNQLDECSNAIDAAAEAIRSASGVMDSEIMSSFHLTCLSYYKAKDKVNDYFSNALLYLSYTPLTSLSPSEQLELATDVSLAGLLGPNVYNLGELLRHPILGVLQSTASVAWLRDMLLMFNRGDIQAFEALLAASTTSQDLKNKTEFLQQKVRVMMLMNVVFERPLEERNITLTELSQVCDVKEDQVELLLMKALALEVIKGEIDQVEGSIRVTWVQPRVLEVSQMGGLSSRLKALADQVKDTTESIYEGIGEENTSIYVGL
jgi:26S proteasome regulatory subunit N9